MWIWQLRPADTGAYQSIGVTWQLWRPGHGGHIIGLTYLRLLIETRREVPCVLSSLLITPPNRRSVSAFHSSDQRSSLRSLCSSRRPALSPCFAFVRIERPWIARSATNLPRDLSPILRHLALFGRLSRKQKKKKKKWRHCHCRHTDTVLSTLRPPVTWSAGSANICQVARRTWVNVGNLKCTFVWKATP